MWIHVPSIPFPSVPGTEELSLDSEQLSQLESSVMWKSNFQQQKSWQNVWKKRLSMRRLSGLLLKPSTLNRGVEKWICSLEGSLASPSASPGRSLEKMIQETSGPTQPDLLGGLGFQSSFLKMCQESSDTTTTPYDPNYERWVTKLRRDSSQRPRLGPLTRGNDSLSWPTPTGTERSGTNPNTGKGEGLNKTAKNWPTPNTMDELPPRSEAANKERFTTGQRAGRKHPDNLREFVHSEMHPKNWPTPRVSSANGPSETELEDNNPKRRLETEASLWPTPTVAEADKIGNRPNYGQQGLSNHPAIVGYPEREKMSKSRAGDTNSTNPDQWPTPNALEHKYRMQGNSQQSNGLTATSRKSLILSTHQDQETGTDGTGSSENTQTLHQPSAKKDTMCSPKCRRLNPAFAEHLMGLPPGWTSVSEPLEMGLYRQWQHSLSELLREN